MNKHILFCLSFLLLTTVKADAQDSFSVRAQRYIEQYYSLAMAEQQRSGIPASVTLAQGVLETEAGRSELACSANNHFGIKCKADYQGAKFFHDDDAPKECFKMYRCAEDSYKDHSDYLKRNQRYSPLFALSQTDYASWAICLRKCGYATNPQYAQRLIKIIEDFKLQQYTYAAMDSSFMPNQPVIAKSTSPFKESAKAAPTPDTAVKGIVLTTFDPVDKPVAITKPKVKPVLTDREKPVVTPAPTPVAEVTTPAVEAPKPTPAIVAAPDTRKEYPKPTATTSFKEIKATADSSHHIIAHDGPLHLQATPGAKSDTPTSQTPQQLQPTQATVDTKFDSGKVITVNGLKAFYAYKGDMLLQYAVKYNVRYPHLLEINDLEDGPLESNMPIYLEKKLSSGTHARHTVKEGETMFLIAQAEGMQLKRLLALNMMDIGDEPAIGVILELQNGVFKKPGLRTVTKEPKSNTTVMLGKSTPPSEMITINRTKPEVKTPEVKKEEPAQYVETIQAPKSPAAETTTVATPPSASAVAPATTIAAAPQPAAATPAVAVQPKHDTVIAKVAPQMKEDTTVDELASLKAELDKVVYTDDSKLAPAPPVKPSKPVANVKPEPKKPAKDHKGKKSDDDDEEEDKKGSNMYTIKNGETLGGIANRHNTTVKKLMQLNHINADEIRAGKKLRVK